MRTPKKGNNLWCFASAQVSFLLGVEPPKSNDLLPLLKR